MISIRSWLFKESYASCEKSKLHSKYFSEWYKLRCRLELQSFSFCSMVVDIVVIFVFIQTFFYGDNDAYSHRG